jgi:hypothetical protein
MYNPTQPFGSISILFIGDFIQLPVTTGCNLWSVMHGTVSSNATIQKLSQQFCIHELTANIHAIDYVIHVRWVMAFSALPVVILCGQKWSANDIACYRPITQDIVDGITHELTSQETKQDPNWMPHSTCIIISNVDRAINGAAAAKAFRKCKKIPVLRWKCQLR